MGTPLLLTALLATTVPPSDEGHLRLTLADAVRFAVESDAARLDRLSYSTARLEVVRASGVFDPTVVSEVRSTDATTPSTVLTQGVPILSDQQHAVSLRVDQRLSMGARAEVGMTGSRTATNDASSTFNPSFASSLQIALTQPLLRDRGGLAERGPVLAARQGAEASKEDLAAQLATIVESTILAYWDAVLAVEGVELRRKSLELAESTRGKNRRLLEMGAIAPLEIHRSESDVASRSLDLLAAQLDARRRLDVLKRTTGLDANPKTAGLEIEVVDRPEVGEAPSVDADAALAQAQASRPELRALERRVDADETQVRVAHDAARPALDLRAAYTAQGVAGTQFDLHQTPAAVLSRTQLGHAFDQVFGRQFPVWEVGISLSLPIVNRAARAAVAQAQVARERDQLARAELQRQIALDVRSAVDQVTYARQAIDITTTVLEHSRKTVEAEQRKYELGTSELFVVLDAQSRLAQAELSVLSAKVSYQTALTRLDLVTGRLLERQGVVVETGAPSAP
jgi:outer membrane protein TolC